MKALEKIIQSLSNQEVRDFRYFIYNHKAGKKNLELFNSIRENVIFDKIGKNDSAHNSLRSRLQVQLEEFILHRTSHSEEYEVIRLVAMAQFLFRKKAFNEGILYLKKAEKKGKELGSFLFLEWVYVQLLEYPFRHLLGNQKQTVLNRAKNFQLLKDAISIHSDYHNIRNQLTFNKIDDGKNATLISVQKIFKKHTSHSTASKLLDLRFNLISITVLSFQDTEFRKLTLFLKEELAALQKIEMNAKQRLFLFKIQHAIASMLVKNKEFAEAETVFYVLKNDIEKFPKEKGHSYAFYAMTLLDIFMCTNRIAEASALLKEVEKLTFQVYDKMFLVMNKVALFFIKEDYGKAKKILYEFVDAKKQLRKAVGLEGVFTKRLIDCIVYYEAKEDALLTSNTRSLQRRLNANKTNDNVPVHRYLLLLNLIKILHKTNGGVNDKFREKAKLFLSYETYTPGGHEIISFNAWIKSKLENKKYYVTFLEDVNALTQ